MRSLVDRVVLLPTAEGKGFEVELVGEIAAMIAAGMGPARRTSQSHSSASDSDMFLRSVKVVAGACFGRELTLPTVAC